MTSQKPPKPSHAARKAADGNKRKALSHSGNKAASSASSQSTKLPIPARTKVATGSSLQDMKSGAIFGRIARAATQRAWTVIVIFILLAGMGVGLAVTKLKVDTNPALMISSKLEFRQQFDSLIKQFPAFERSFLLIVESDDPGLSRQIAAKLEKKLLSRPELFQQVTAPGIGAFFDDYGVLYANPDEVKKITDQIKQSAPAFNALAENPNIAGLSGVLNELSAYTQAGRAPEGAESFIDAISTTVENAVKGERKPLDWLSVAGPAEDGVSLTEKRWFVMSQPVLNFAELEPAAAPLEEARRLLTDPELTANGTVTIKLTGYTALNAEEFEAVTKGAAIAGIISFALVSLIVFFGLPTVTLVVPALSLIVLGFLINAGFATLSVGYLNMISVAFAVLFIGLGIDYAVHVILRFSEYRAKGQSGADAAVSAVEKTGPALALCTITTALAFLAFTPTDFVGMAQLGIIAAGGMVIAFIASITLVPAILTLLPGQQHKYEKNMASLNSVSGEDKTAHSQTRTIATTFVLVLAVAALFLFPQARFDGDPINLKDPEAPTVQAFLEILHDHPGEVYSGQVLVEPGQAALDMIAKLKALPGVKKIHYIEDFLPKDQDAKLVELNSLNEFVPRVVKSGADIGEVVRERMLGSIATNMKAMSDVSDAPEVLKTSAIRLQKAITQFEAQNAGKPEKTKSLEEDLFVKLPDMLAEINKLASINAVSVDSLQKNLRERFVAPDGRWRLEVVPAKDMRKSENLKEFVNQLQSVDPAATGAPMDIAGSADAVSKSMINATLAALFMVAILSWLALRNVLDVALVLSPLVLAACLMVGYTVTFDSPFNFANVIVLPLLLGLGVDSSIHYVMRAREETVATDVTGTSTPRAVLISALTTVGSFGTLWLSGHRGMSSMGELLTIAILVTLICTLVVLPQLMHWVSSRARS